MAKQQFMGPPAWMKEQRPAAYTYPDNVLHGWYYVPMKEGVAFSHPQYNLYQYLKVTDINSTWAPSCSIKACCLHWNGARWMVWVRNLFIAEPTDFQDINDPPIEWAEGMYRLVNT